MTIRVTRFQPIWLPTQIQTTLLFFRLLNFCLARVKSNLSLGGPAIWMSIALLRFFWDKLLRSAVFVSLRTEKPRSQSAVVTATTRREHIILMILATSLLSWWHFRILIIVSLGDFPLDRDTVPLTISHSVERASKSMSKCSAKIWKCMKYFLWKLNIFRSHCFCVTNGHVNNTPTMQFWLEFPG